MSTTSTITPTSSLTPLDLLPPSGPVDYYKDRPYAIDEHQNFKRLGSFWTRQMSHDGKKHAKALSLTGICTNSLMDVQNVKNNLANDKDNLYFNNITVPIEGVIKVKGAPHDIMFSDRLLKELIDPDLNIEDYLITKNKSSNKCIELSSTASTFYVWRLSEDINITKLTFKDRPFSSFRQFGRWVFSINSWFKLLIFDLSLEEQPLCSGYYSSNSYFGQSFYKPLLNLEYLPVGPGAKFVADYISGKHQNPQALEVFLNTIVGLEATIGRNVSQVISLDNYIYAEPTPETDPIKKRWLVLQDKITTEKYNLVYYGDKDTSITEGTILPTNSFVLPPNSFAKYLVQIAIKQGPKGATFNRVTPYNSSAITIDRLQASSVFPTQDNIMYKGDELKKLIIKLDSTMIVHLGELYDWYKYHEYMSNRSDYFKSHFKTYKDLINYVIRTVREYAPITYKPLFTCTWATKTTSNELKSLTTDYQLYLKYGGVDINGCPEKTTALLSTDDTLNFEDYDNN